MTGVFKALFGGWKFLAGRAASREENDASQLPRNVGAELLEWPARAEIALGMLQRQLAAQAQRLRVGDFGCGRQTLRRMLPAEWTYLPVDYCRRTPDTVVCDFNRELPGGDFDVIMGLGVLEYLDRPEDFLAHCLGCCQYLLFSYNGFTSEERRIRQGWRNNLAFVQIEQLLEGQGAAILAVHELGNNERIYLVQGSRR